MQQLVDGHSTILLRRPCSRIVSTFRFSDALFADDVTVASSRVNRDAFVSSLVDFLQKYGLDGVDIDWEYPAAEDRGGKKEDTQNFVLLMSEIQQAFQAANPGWEATVTLPTSYWYLRGFDVNGLQKYVSWFNLMSYDLVSLSACLRRPPEADATRSMVCGTNTMNTQALTWKGTPTFQKSMTASISFGETTLTPKT